MVHLINPMWSYCGGSEWRTIELYRDFAAVGSTTIWSEYSPAIEFQSMNISLKRISPEHGQYPDNGVLIVVGIYHELGHWTYLSNPRRIILVCNGFSPKKLAARLNQLTLEGRRNVEIVFTSQWLADVTAISGRVNYSPIDLARFSDSNRRYASNSPFVVGRLSRDEAKKHHPNDLALYERLVSSGCEVRIMGGTCLREITGNHKGITLIPAGTLPPEEFLSSLDCFLYRTSPTYREPSGRVVTEAMACGLPVVCEKSGGYRELITHAQNGFLFETDEEAVEYITMLQRNSCLSARIGQNARACMERIFSEELRKEFVYWCLA